MSPVSARLHVGLSPVVPLTTTPSWPCSTRWWAIAAVPSRSTAPSSVKAVAIAVSIRPKGAGDVMRSGYCAPAASRRGVLVARCCRWTGHASTGRPAPSPHTRRRCSPKTGPWPDQQPPLGPAGREPVDRQQRADEQDDPPDDLDHDHDLLLRRTGDPRRR